MAEAINTGGIRPVTLPGQFPPIPAVARILSRFDRGQLAGFIAVAIDLADAMDGDSDIEDDDPAEAIGDEKDAAWVEWHQMRGAQKRGPNIAQAHEDDEDDDPDCGLDEGEPNFVAVSDGAAGCPIAGDLELNGDEGDYGGEVDGI